MSIVLAILFLLILPNMFARVPAGYEVIIERRGKFHRLLKPGIHGIFIPFVDRAARSFLMKVQQFDLPKFVAPNKEDLPFTVVSELRYQILDSMKVYQNVPNPREALIQLAQTAILAVMKQYEGFEAIESRRSVENAIQRRIEDGARNWGIKVMEFKVHAVTPPDEVIKALEAQVQRERAQREQQSRDANA